MAVKAGEHAEVAVRPPVLILGSLLLGSVLEIAWPIGPGLGNGSPALVLIGFAAALIGSTVFARAHRQFAAAGNAVSPRAPTQTLTTTGLYAYSRNPIYGALIVVYAGMACALACVWASLLLPVVAIVMRRAIIDPEERYLARRFGEQYRAYAARVRRWL